MPSVQLEGSGNIIVDPDAAEDLLSGPILLALNRGTANNLTLDEKSDKVIDFHSNFSFFFFSTF